MRSESWATPTRASPRMCLSLEKNVLQDSETFQSLYRLDINGSIDWTSYSAGNLSAVDHVDYVLFSSAIFVLR